MGGTWSDRTWIRFDRSWIRRTQSDRTWLHLDRTWTPSFLNRRHKSKISRLQRRRREAVSYELSSRAAATRTSKFLILRATARSHLHGSSPTPAPSGPCVQTVVSVRSRNAGRHRLTHPNASQVGGGRHPRGSYAEQLMQKDRRRHAGTHRVAVIAMVGREARPPVVRTAAPTPRVTPVATCASETRLDLDTWGEAHCAARGCKPRRAARDSALRNVLVMCMGAHSTARR